MSERKDSPCAPAVKIMLDKERELKFPIPSIFALEDLTGVDIFGGLKDEEEFYGGTKEKPATTRQRFNRIIDVIWAGLIADDPQITRDFVAKFVYLVNLPDLDQACGKAFFSSLTKMKEDENGAPLATTSKGPSRAGKSGRSRAKS